MQKFRFPLESAMQYRQLQLDMERAKLESLYAELRRLDAQKLNLAEDKAFADTLVKGVDRSFALSLLALDNFSRHVTTQQTLLDQKRAECFRLIAKQQQQVMAAQRNYDLLEKLRGKKLAAWQRAADSEIEQIASEAHMARIARQDTRFARDDQ